MFRGRFNKIINQFALLLAVSTLAFTNMNEVFAQETTANQTSVVEQRQNYQFESPQTIIEALQKKPENMAMSYSVSTADTETEYSTFNLSFVRDGDFYYYMTQWPGLLKSSALIITKDGKFDRSLVLAEDLAHYIAEGLNNFEEEYKDTEFEKFYVYAQNNIDKIRGVYVENDESTKAHQVIFSESQQVEGYLLSLMSELIKDETLKPEVLETDEVGQTYQYTIDEEVAKKMATISERLSKGNEVLQPISNLFKMGFVGTLGFSLETGDISLSVATLNGVNVIEASIGMEESKVARPDDSKIMTVSDFNEMIGIDLFDALKKQTN